jgi:hypothetical protein
MGITKAHNLSLITAPANKAMAICGAKFTGRGTILYNAATIVSNKKLRRRFLFIFIIQQIMRKNK